jgi:ornithine cyclodeaminase/alanine dehydrogenase-like protein (mu-crystallin family)
VLIIGADTVRRLLPMPECIEAMDRAMRAASNGAVHAPARIIAPLTDGLSYFIVMPGCLESPPLYGAKLVSLHPSNPGRELPAVQGFVALFDGASGSPVALIDGAEITRLRTAAASALATRALARTDAVTHGIFGAGVQAASHLEAIACVRPIERVRVWARDPARARAFAQGQPAVSGAAVEAVEDPAEAAACAIVSVVTNAGEPVLQGAWLQPGAHVNLVGAHEPQHREADSEAIARAAVYVDSRAGALREAGDLLIPIGEGRIDAAHILGEIGEVLEGRAPGRRDAGQVTLYKSLGMIAQDLFAAARVFAAAQSHGAGASVDFP